MIINKWDKFKNAFAEQIEIIVYQLRENWGRVIVFFFIIYGAAILYKGVIAGVYLTNTDSYLYNITKFLMYVKDVQCFTPPDDSGYSISFFASAEEDYWFFLIIGLAVSIPSLKSPKTDGIRTKIKHFFPTLKESSPYMAEIIELMNKASCITTNFSREMIIIERKGDLFKVIIKTKFVLKNLHHNHKLDHNIGNFEIVPDQKPLNDSTLSCWGEMIDFSDSEGNDVCKASIMCDDSFDVKSYNIKLNEDEEREYNCHYNIWFDKEELIKIGFIRFTQSVDIKISNQTDTKFKIDIKRFDGQNEIPINDLGALLKGKTLSTIGLMKNLS